MCSWNLCVPPLQLVIFFIVVSSWWANSALAPHGFGLDHSGWVEDRRSSVLDDGLRIMHIGRRFSVWVVLERSMELDSKQLWSVTTQHQYWTVASELFSVFVMYDIMIWTRCKMIFHGTLFVNICWWSVLYPVERWYHWVDYYKN